MKNFKNFIFENRSVRKIYLDMDSVLCDFLKKFKEKNNIDFIEYSDKYGWKKTWKNIEMFGVEFWSELEWYPGGKKLWNFLKKLDNVEILTGSPRDKVGDYAREGKEIWIKKNIGDIKINHIEGRLKYKYVKNRDILIDDSERNCEMWEKAGGIPILHKNAEDTIQKLKKII